MQHCSDLIQYAHFKSYIPKIGILKLHMNYQEL